VARRWGDRSKVRFDVFRVALTCLSLVVTLGVIGLWQGLNQADRFSTLEPRVSAVWIVGLVGLCVIQVAMLWWARIDLSWWEPLLIEVGLCMAFGVVAHQVGGTHMTSCYSEPPGPQTCTTIQPGIIHGSWLGLFAVVGLVLGVVWSVSSRPSRRETAPSQ
jgi:hypothetical protein